jgi:hypothetical protein
MRWAGRVARVDDIRNANYFFVGMSEGKRRLIRSRRRVDDSIKKEC